MALSKDDVLHVAKLARVGLTDEEAEKFTGELEQILNYVDQLQEADTEGVKETAIVTGTKGIVRPDEVTNSDRRDELLEMSVKQKRGGSILVDNII